MTTGRLVQASGERAFDLCALSHGEKAALIRALSAQVQALTVHVAELEAKLGELPKNSDNSSQPLSRDSKPSREDKLKREGPRQGSLGRKGGGRALSANPDETVTARPKCCAQCQAAFDAADHRLVNRYDKIELPKVKPVVTRVELYAGHCQGCGATTLAPLPQGLEPGSPFSINIVALALYLRFTHAIAYKRLSRMMLELFGLAISEGALDAALRRAKPRMDAEVSAILVRLRRARVVFSDETSVRVDGQTRWNWVFQHDEVVIHVIRHSRGASVVGEVMGGYRPALWVSDLYSTQHAIEAGDAVFAPRMKMLLLRAGRKLVWGSWCQAFIDSPGLGKAGLVETTRGEHASARDPRAAALKGRNAYPRKTAPYGRLCGRFPGFRSDAGNFLCAGVTDGLFAAYSHFLQSVLDAMSGFSLAYFTQQTGSLTRRMILLAIHAERLTWSVRLGIGLLDNIARSTATAQLTSLSLPTQGAGSSSSHPTSPGGETHTQQKIYHDKRGGRQIVQLIAQPEMD